MTVVASAKAKLVGENGVLAALMPSGVEVHYSVPQTIKRDLVYGGSVAGSVGPVAMASGARVKRSEDLTLQLHVRVWKSGKATTEAAEERAAAIANEIDRYIAANWTLGGLDGLKKAEVSALNLDSWTDDDGAGAVLTMTVDLMSYLS